MKYVNEQYNEIRECTGESFSIQGKPYICKEILEYTRKSFDMQGKHLIYNEFLYHTRKSCSMFLLLYPERAEFFYTNSGECSANIYTYEEFTRLARD